MIEKIKELRSLTKISLGECKKALEKAGGSIDDAIILLQGVSGDKLRKRVSHVASQGRIQTYIHTGAQIASIVEVNCETDFAARSDIFIKFCEDIAMQVVAMHPVYISADDISKEQITSQEEFIQKRLSEHHEDKSPDYIENNIKDKMRSWIRESVLTEQTSVMDQSKTVNDLLEKLSNQLGEKIVITRFERWAVGSELPTDVD